MEILDYLATENFTAGNNRSIDFIVMHYTANDGDTALNNAVYFNSTYRGASAHYFVDETQVVRVVEDKNTAWHCGTTGTFKHATCRNANSIGIEMCSRKDAKGNYYIMEETQARAIELAQYLMELHSIPIENVVRHYDVTGKSCPAPMVDETVWANFKEEIDMATLTQEQFETMHQVMEDKKLDNDCGTWSEAERQWAIDNGLIVGNGTTVDGQPNYMWASGVTREQLVVMLHRDNVRKGTA